MTQYKINKIVDIKINNIIYLKFDTNHHCKYKNRLNNEHREEQLLNCLVDQQAKSQQNQRSKMEHKPFATKTNQINHI